MPIANLPELNTLILEQKEEALTIWFNRPEVKNALSTELTEELLSVLQALADDSSVRTVILRGKGGAFCSGGDLKMFKTIFQGGVDRQEIVDFNASFGQLMKAVHALPQLFVVLIEGVAMAGGLGLSCIADVVVTTKDARFSLTEVSIGLPPAQITPVVIKRIGASEARRLLLTAQHFNGIEAGRLGFAHHVVEDREALDAMAEKIIAQNRKCAPGAVDLTKQIINACDPLDSHYLQGDELVTFAAERFADAMLGDEAREGMKSFAEKRKPNWA
ncbi:MAG: isohexenylglutaconyl-CoA hydratase [Candidatus Pelagadaptatus aseana]|uniref:enoyl-CoA hydratase-related protein n=1 Tax=Candidatus Pelagadaptatus aseana TaxID=3120508 RepID=UPI0039B203F8